MDLLKSFPRSENGGVYDKNIFDSIMIEKLKEDRLTNADIMYAIYKMDYQMDLMTLALKSLHEAFQILMTPPKPRASKPKRKKPSKAKTKRKR